MKYDLILGFDYGHGECSAEAVRLDEPDHYVRLHLDQALHQAIPTAIWYDESGETKIGYEAMNRPGMIPYFKRSPAEWTDEQGQEAQIQGPKVVNLMSDYLRDAFNQMFTYNTEILNREKKILLVVGAPASKRWLSSEYIEAYRTMIRLASGIEDVWVMPESRAAIFSAYRRNVAGANASAGVAVFDFGSLTADFTYMQTGAMLLERSWVLGAHQVERQMLTSILRYYDFDPSEMNPRQRSGFYAKLREQKEKFYSEAISSDPSTLSVELVDEDGELRTTVNQSGRQIPVTKTLTYPFDGGTWQEFMEDVVGNANNRFPVYFDGHPMGEYCWKNACRAFFEAMKNLLDQRDLPCSSIVLTGGASLMSFVRELANEVFGAERVTCEAEPAFTVAAGLCVIGQFDQQLPELIDKHLPAIQSAARDTYLTACQNMAPGLVDALIPFLTSFMKGQTEEITVGTLTKKLNSYIDSNREKINEALRPHLDECIEAVRNVMMEYAVNAGNETSEELYNRPGSLVQFSFNQQSFGMLLDENLRKALSGDALIQSLDLPSLLISSIGSILSIAISVGIMIALDIINPILGFLIGTFVGRLVDGIAEVLMRNENRRLRQRDLMRVQEMLSDPADCKKFADKFVQKVKTLLTEDSDNRSKLFNSLDETSREMLTAAINIVALAQNSFEQIDVMS